MAMQPLQTVDYYGLFIERMKAQLPIDQRNAVFADMWALQNSTLKYQTAGSSPR